MAVNQVFELTVCGDYPDPSAVPSGLRWGPEVGRDVNMQMEVEGPGGTLL